MAKTWYPVIDYTLCADCGKCIAKCPHDVYNQAKSPVPVVFRPEACIDHCHGCGNRCSSGAITYLGEDTGWTPPHGRPTVRDEACGCGCRDETTCADDTTEECACGSGASAPIRRSTKWSRPIRLRLH